MKRLKPKIYDDYLKVLKIIDSIKTDGEWAQEQSITAGNCVENFIRYWTSKIEDMPSISEYRQELFRITEMSEVHLKRLKEKTQLIKEQIAETGK